MRIARVHLNGTFKALFRLGVAMQTTQYDPQVQPDSRLFGPYIRKFQIKRHSAQQITRRRKGIGLLPESVATRRRILIHTHDAIRVAAYG
jgi:hypothetical protein